MQSGSIQVCVQFGAVDDIIVPVIEDIEFYQISLTTTDNIAQVLQELSVANVFIEDNDGKHYI